GGRQDRYHNLRIERVPQRRKPGAQAWQETERNQSRRDKNGQLYELLEKIPHETRLHNSAVQTSVGAPGALRPLNIFCTKRQNAGMSTSSMTSTGRRLTWLPSTDTAPWSAPDPVHTERAIAVRRLTIVGSRNIAASTSSQAIASPVLST